MKIRKSTPTPVPPVVPASDSTTLAHAASSTGRASRISQSLLGALSVCASLFCGLCSSASAAPELPVKKELTLQVANQLADAAQAEAEKRNAAVVITVVDDGGYPI